MPNPVVSDLIKYTNSYDFINDIGGVGWGDRCQLFFQDVKVFAAILKIGFRIKIEATAMEIILFEAISNVQARKPEGERQNNPNPKEVTMTDPHLRDYLWGSSKANAMMGKR